MSKEASKAKAFCGFLTEYAGLYTKCDAGIFEYLNPLILVCRLTIMEVTR